MKLTYLFAIGFVLSASTYSLAKPEGDLKRVYEAFNVDHYGFMEKVIVCSHISNVLEQYEKKDDKFYPANFLPEDWREKYTKNFFDYFKINDQRASDEINAILERPLSAKIVRWWRTEPYIEQSFFCLQTSFVFMAFLNKWAENNLPQGNQNADNPSSRHNQCLNARDYKGCMSHN